MGLTQVSTDGVKNDAITKTKIPANQIEASELADNAVDTNAIANDAITRDKIADDVIASEHFIAGEVDTTALATNAVTTAKIADDAVTADKLANSINTAIAANTAKDLTALSASNLTSGTIPDARLPATLPAISGANLTNLPAGGKVTNLVMNGNFKLAQRGTSHGSSGYRTVDRWKMSAGGASAALTQSQYGAISGTSPYAEGHHQAYRFLNAGQNANTAGYVNMQHSIEAQDIVSSGWNYKSSSSYITLSFWVRGSVTQTYLVSLLTNDGTAREWNHLVSLSADAWTKVTMTIPGDSNITMNNDNGIGLTLYFHAYLGSDYTSGSTVDQWVNHAGYTSRPDMGAGWWTTSNSTFMLTGVQLEAGNSASDYAHESFSETLQKCKRYCHVVASQQYSPIGIGFQYYSATIFIPYGPIDMRTTPTMVAKAGVSGAYLYEKVFSNSPEYHHQIGLDSKTKKDHAMFTMSGDASKAGDAVRISVHAVTLNNNEPFVYLDAEL
tara:strand:+ start:904 stop:2400 length:1497 start_codon:yes stop_codon:yes gene_type:complete